MALRLTGSAPLPEQGREASPGIGEEGIAADQIAQLPFGLLQVAQLEGGQGGTGTGHRKAGPRIGRRREARPGRRPVAAGALHVAEVVVGRCIKGIALQDPGVVSGGLIPAAQGLLGGTPVEMGIGVVGLQQERVVLVVDGGEGIAQSQLDVAAVAPGGSILRGLFEHAVPEGEGQIEAAGPTGLKGPLEQLGHGRGGIRRGSGEILGGSLGPDHASKGW